MKVLSSDPAFRPPVQKGKAASSCFMLRGYFIVLSALLIIRMSRKAGRLLVPISCVAARLGRIALIWMKNSVKYHHHKSKCRRQNARTWQTEHWFLNHT